MTVWFFASSLMSGRHMWLGLRESMKEHNRVPFSGHKIVDANSVDFSELALRRLRERRFQANGCAQRQQNHFDDFHETSRD